MISNSIDILILHVKSNSNKYFFLILVFIIGVSTGAFTVNGLSTVQRDELVNYFQGFLQLFNHQIIENNELFKISLLENVKLVALLWILGVTIIGIPFIYVIIGIRGFITGFSAGFIISSLGFKGVIFIICTLLLKEIVIVPSLMALGVNGINFSLEIIKRKSIKHIAKKSLRSTFLKYCMTTLFFGCFIIIGILIEVYITPVFVRILTPIIIK